MQDAFMDLSARVGTLEEQVSALIERIGVDEETMEYMAKQRVVCHDSELATQNFAQSYNAGTYDLDSCVIDATYPADGSAMLISHSLYQYSTSGLTGSLIYLLQVDDGGGFQSLTSCELRGSYSSGLSRIYHTNSSLSAYTTLMNPGVESHPAPHFSFRLRVVVTGTVYLSAGNAGFHHAFEFIPPS